VSVDLHLTRRDQLDRVAAAVVEQTGAPLEHQPLARLDHGPIRERGPQAVSGQVVVDPPAVQVYGRRAEVEQLGPLAAARRRRHKLVDHDGRADALGSDIWKGGADGRDSGKQCGEEQALAHGRLLAGQRI
jgi:hypothetical protein